MPKEETTRVEVRLATPSLYIKIGNKTYTVSMSEDGIFISSTDGLRVTKQSEAGNWLFVK